MLVAPLPQKSHTAARVAIFGDPVIFKGTHIIKSQTFTPSVSRGVGKLSARAKSVVFALASNFVLTFCFKLMKQKVESLRALPSAARFFWAHQNTRAAFTRSGRRYATNWGRFLRSAVLKRAFNSIKPYFYGKSQRSAISANTAASNGGCSSTKTAKSWRNNFHM